MLWYVYFEVLFTADELKGIVIVNTDDILTADQLREVIRTSEQVSAEGKCNPRKTCLEYTNPDQSSKLG